MNLYEITNGYMGESYVRAYVWAASEQAALELVQGAFLAQQITRGYDDDYSQALEVALLFSADAEPFCTIPDSAGWEMPADDH